MVKENLLFTQSNIQTLSKRLNDIKIPSPENELRLKQRNAEEIHINKRTII
jgi:hypothetical protein